MVSTTVQSTLQKLPSTKRFNEAYDLIEGIMALAADIERQAKRKGIGIKIAQAMRTARELENRVNMFLDSGTLETACAYIRKTALVVDKIDRYVERHPAVPQPDPEPDPAPEPVSFYLEAIRHERLIQDTSKSRADRAFRERVTLENSCWMWSGALRNGSPVFIHTGLNVSARKYAYEMVTGQDYTGSGRPGCGNRLCCNPYHLKDVKDDPNLFVESAA